MGTEHPRELQLFLLELDSAGTVRLCSPNNIVFRKKKTQLFVEILVDLGPKDSNHTSPAVTTNSHLESEEIRPSAW